MPRFKIGDRVRVVRPGGSWLGVYLGAVGTIWDECVYPWIDFDDGTRDCGSEECLELVSEETHTPSYIEINGKRYRLVEEV